MNTAAIVVMAKQPQRGQSKTRLCPPLSFAQAAQTAEALLLDTLALVGTVSSADLAIAITPPGSEPYFANIAPPGTRLLPVEGRDIGSCLDQVLQRLLALGYRQVLALNADGPSLPPAVLSQAVVALETQDLILGPTRDGGYYLIGLVQPQPALFTNIAWSTSTVCAQTLQRARALGLQTALLPSWYDIDTPHDLQRLQAELSGLPPEKLVYTRRLLSTLNLAERLS